jgi:transcription elongation factor Elf1
MKKYFVCPECGRKEVSVQDMDKAIATVKCGSCGIQKKVPKMRMYEPIDFFGDFIDLYNQDKGVDTEYRPTDDKEEPIGLKRERSIKEVFGDNTGYLEF